MRLMKAKTFRWSRYWSLRWSNWWPRWDLWLISPSFHVKCFYNVHCKGLQLLTCRLYNLKKHYFVVKQDSKRLLMKPWWVQKRSFSNLYLKYDHAEKPSQITFGGRSSISYAASCQTNSAGQVLLGRISSSALGTLIFEEWHFILILFFFLFFMWSC